MVIELTLVFLVPTHLSHLLEGIKHRLHDLVVCSIDNLSDFERVCTDELCFDPADIGWEVFDERRDTLTLLACELGLFDRLDVVVLEQIISTSQT